MDSPHGSLFRSHWKCAAVVCEVNRIERFRCWWKTPQLESWKWMLYSRALCLYLPSFCPQLMFVFWGGLHIFNSYLMTFLLFCFSLCVCVFFLISSLDRHVQSHHGHHKPFRCKFCPFKSAYVSRLKSHLHKAHTGKSHFTDVSMTVQEQQPSVYYLSHYNSPIAYPVQWDQWINWGSSFRRTIFGF